MRDRGQLEINKAYWTHAADTTEGRDRVRNKAIVAATRFALAHSEAEVQAHYRLNQGYRPHGNDDLDVYADGYITGLEWALGMLEWTA